MGTIETITRADFDAALAADTYWRGRWEYIDVVRRWIAAGTWPDWVRVLEIGPYTLPIVPGSHVMDVREFPGGPDVLHLHDAAATPWPMADAAYDLVIATQVWEHLGGCQADGFAELRRCSRAAILTLPYNWPAAKGDHAGITLKRVVTEWAGGLEPVAFAKVGTPPYQRAVYAWQFGPWAGPGVKLA